MFIQLIIKEKAGECCKIKRSATSNRSPGAGGADTLNLQSFAAIPTISGVTDIDSENGFTIQLGKIAADGTVSNATTTDFNKSY